MRDKARDKALEFLNDLGRFVPALNDIQVGMRDLLKERDRLKAELATLRESEEAAQHAAKRAVDELAKLKAEREPRDNGDGTVTAWKPVTFFKSLDVSEVRAPKKGELCAGYCGASSANANSDFEPGTVRLILRPAPKPVTWEAPLVDGLWLAKSEYLEHVDTKTCFCWDGSLTLFIAVAKPAKLGTYAFEAGVGTLIQEAGHE